VQKTQNIKTGFKIFFLIKWNLFNFKMNLFFVCLRDTHILKFCELVLI
jgi:hypothetical protein